MLGKKLIAFIVAALISSMSFAQAKENTQFFRLVSVNNNQAEFEKIWQASQSRMNNVFKATIQGKEVIVSGPFTYQKAQEMQQRFIEKGINNVQFFTREQINITQQGRSPTNIPSVAQEPSNNSLQTSSKITNNFLIGACDISATINENPPVTSCNVNALENRPVWASSVIKYEENSFTYMLVWGKKKRDSQYNDGKPNTIANLSLNYSIENKDNIVIEEISSTGCSSKTRFSREGDVFYKKQLSYSGACSSNQALAHQHAIKEGKRRAHLIRH
jgi:hypothetical protein